MTGRASRWEAGISKGDVLRRLAGRVTTAVVDPGYLIRRSEWSTNGSDPSRQATLRRLAGQPLIVRSSAYGEDSESASHAGIYDSIALPDRPSVDEIARAVESVFACYADPHQEDAAFIQRYVSDVTATAVVTTRTLATGAPYVTLAIDHQPTTSDRVTSGHGNVTTWHLLDGLRQQVSEGLSPTSAEQKTVDAFLSTTREVAGLLMYPDLDLELIEDSDRRVHLLQVRPLVLPAGGRGYLDDEVKVHVDHAQQQASHVLASAPRTSDYPGDTATGFLSNTTDWNPAEMLGQRPHTLAVSLYRHAITDRIWSTQRAGYGYRDLRGRPLMHILAGHPYIDVAASLLSLMPARLPAPAADHLLQNQLQLLRSNRDLHRSVEFNVTINCADFTLQRRLKTGPSADLSLADQRILSESLLAITDSAIVRLPSDLNAVATAAARRRRHLSHKDPGVRALALLAEIPVGAALPFAHVARAAFIATAFLRSSHEDGLADADSTQAFMRGLHTISSRIREDGARVARGLISWEAFVDRYGHLRPGTYDLREPSYREEPDRYLRPFVMADGDAALGYDLTDTQPQNWFVAELDTISARLFDLGLRTDAATLLWFAGAAIRGREDAKFEYSAWICAILDAIDELGGKLGADPENLIHWDLADVNRAVMTGQVPNPELLEQRRHEHLLTTMTHMPSTIAPGDNLARFREPPGVATYIGTGCVTAEAHHNPQPGMSLHGIVVVDQADPGFEWLFGHQLSGLITAQGGANSHLAVRCAELGIPAAIGVGEDRVTLLRDATLVRIDCRNKIVDRIR